MSATTVKLNLCSSAMLGWFYLLIHAGALICLHFTALDTWARLIMAFGTVLSAWALINEHAWRRSPSAFVALQMDENGRCQLWQRNGVCRKDWQLTGGANFHLALCLNLRGPKAEIRHLILARDALTDEALRSVRMRFEHALIHGNPVRV